MNFKNSHINNKYEFESSQADLIKIIALVLMTLDHISKSSIYESVYFDLLGRTVFPLFAIIWGYYLSKSWNYTKSSIGKLLVWAIIVQPFYAYMLGLKGEYIFQGNILFSFCVATLLIKSFYSRGFKDLLVAASSLALWLPFSLSSYGLSGIMTLVFSFLVFRTNNENIYYITGFIVSIVLLNFNNSYPYILMSTIGTGFIIMLCKSLSHCLPLPNRRLVPRSFFLYLYVGHICILSMVKYLLLDGAGN
ncbi:hypothetical protein GKR75_08145 [Providencia sp. wls1919]|nr:hypothetical protein [Providencia sp. wls1919]